MGGSWQLEDPLLGEGPLGAKTKSGCTVKIELTGVLTGWRLGEKWRNPGRTIRRKEPPLIRMGKTTTGEGKKICFGCDGFAVNHYRSAWHRFFLLDYSKAASLQYLLILK